MLDKNSWCPIHVWTLNIQQNLMIEFNFNQCSKKKKTCKKLPHRERVSGHDGGLGVDLWLAPSTLTRVILVCLWGAQGCVDWAAAQDAVTGGGFPRSAVVSAILSVKKFHLDTRQRLGWKGGEEQRGISSWMFYCLIMVEFLFLLSGTGVLDLFFASHFLHVCCANYNPILHETYHICLFSLKKNTAAPFFLLFSDLEES